MKKVLYIFDDEDIAWMVEVGSHKIVAAGTVLVTEGTEIDSLILIVQGKVDVSLHGKTLTQIDNGEVLGEISLLDNRPPTATVTTLVETEYLEIPRDILQRKLAIDNNFAARFYHALSLFLAKRIRTLTQFITHLDAKTLTDSGFGGEAYDELDMVTMEEITHAAERFESLLSSDGQHI